MLFCSSTTAVPTAAPHAAHRRPCPLLLPLQLSSDPACCCSLAARQRPKLIPARSCVTGNSSAALAHSRLSRFIDGPPRSPLHLLPQPPMSAQHGALPAQTNRAHFPIRAQGPLPPPTHTYTHRSTAFSGGLSSTVSHLHMTPPRALETNAPRMSRVYGAKCPRSHRKSILLASAP